MRHVRSWRGRKSTARRNKNYQLRHPKLKRENSQGWFRILAVFAVFVLLFSLRPFFLFPVLAEQQATLRVIKHVINDDQGEASADDFRIRITGNDPSPREFPGDEEGTLVTLDPGGYRVTESGPSKYYTADFSEGCSGIIERGRDKTCTIVNDDVSPPPEGQAGLIVVKRVINDNGGTAAVGDFPLYVGETRVESGTRNFFELGDYKVSETQRKGYAATFDGKCNEEGRITLLANETVKCIIINDDIAPKLRVVKEVKNDDGGHARASDFELFVGEQKVVNRETYSFNAGTYVVSETGPAGYTPSFRRDCAPDGTTTLQVGDERKICFLLNDDQPASLTVIKKVNNGYGGTATSSDFLINVNGDRVSNPEFPGWEKGTTVTLLPRDYSVDELPAAGYSKNLSEDCSGRLTQGEHKTCIITNDELPRETQTSATSTLFVIKQVINHNVGTTTPADFTINVSGTNPNPSSFFGSASGTVVVLENGPYQVSESGPSGYLSTISSDCGGTMSGGQQKTCTIVNDYQLGDTSGGNGNDGTGTGGGGGGGSSGGNNNSSGGGGNPSGGGSVLPTPQVAGAFTSGIDLTITNLPDVTTVLPGRTIVYTYNYANLLGESTGIVITTEVPFYTTFNGSASSGAVAAASHGDLYILGSTESSPGWSCLDQAIAGTKCSYQIGSLNAGYGDAIQFAVTVDKQLPGEAVSIANSVSIADDGTHGPDINPNNSSGITAATVSVSRVLGATLPRTGQPPIWLLLSLLIFSVPTFSPKIRSR